MGGAVQATHLNPSQESQFQQWKSVNAPNDSGSDYDLRGAFLADVKPDPIRHHMTDEFKMPNHPTFSTGSKYSTPQHMGGEWSNAQGRDAYEPSKWMESDPKRMADLQVYMKEREPNAVLIRRPLQ